MEKQSSVPKPWWLVQQISPPFGIPRCCKKEASFTGTQIITVYQRSMSPFSANKQDPLGLPVFSLGGVEMLTLRLRSIKVYINLGENMEVVAKTKTLGNPNLYLLTSSHSQTNIGSWDHIHIPLTNCCAFCQKVPYFAVYSYNARLVFGPNFQGKNFFILIF